MAPNTFFTFFLRIFGLYLIWQTLTLVPSVFSTLIYYGSTPDSSGAFSTVSAIVFIILFFIAILRYCIFKTDWIIEKLRLTKGLAEEKIDINLHRSSLLSIAIIVLGGLMLADGLPLLTFNIIEYIQANSTYQTFSQNRFSPYIVSNLLKVIIGYFMVADSRLVVNFIERRKRKAQVNIGQEEGSVEHNES